MHTIMEFIDDVTTMYGTIDNWTATPFKILRALIKSQSLDHAKTHSI